MELIFRSQKFSMNVRNISKPTRRVFSFTSHLLCATLCSLEYNKPANARVKVGSIFFCCRKRTATYSNTECTS